MNMSALERPKALECWPGLERRSWRMRPSPSICREHKDNKHSLSVTQPVHIHTAHLPSLRNNLGPHPKSRNNFIKWVTKLCASHTHTAQTPHHTHTHPMHTLKWDFWDSCLWIDVDIFKEGVEFQEKKVLPQHNPQDSTDSPPSLRWARF